MSGMGQHFGGSFLQVAFDRFASPELVDFIRRWKIDLDEVESLKRTSAKIQALSDDAELKQFTSDAVKLWFDHLKQLLYDAEDVLDEYATQLLHLKLESQFHETHPHQIQQSGTESAVKGINETMKGNIGPKAYNIVEELQGIEGFGSKVRGINDKLEREEREGVRLGLIMQSGSSRPGKFNGGQSTGSLVNISNVFGRDEDISKIFKWLLPLEKTPCPSKSDSNFSVLSIVGIGGSGKTTLAQRVYNDVAVENSRRFHLKAWVCVSEDFDEARLIKGILDSAVGSSPLSNSLDALQRKLKETLSRKRFLLVLDDMWNEEYEKWDALSTSFAFGLPGSKILVTTRSKRVSSMVCPVSNDHDLKGLSPNACLDIIRKHAFMHGNSSYANLKLELFGQAIVEKCKGLPLAVKTLASLLRGKMENSEWEDILENQIWKLKEDKILPSLMLSYHHLPPLLKRCFAYCSLFPKDYVFNKIELVMLWMAEGFVQPKGRKRPEDIGHEYFDELFKRSFFELSDPPHDYLTFSFVGPNHRYAGERSFYELLTELHMRSFFESSSNMGSGFVMHDLIHDLAQFVSDGMYCRRENDKPANVLTSVTRHFSYLMDNGDIDATKFGDMKSLRTFADLKNHWHSFNNAFDYEPLPTMQFQFLRVLRIRNSSIHELPDSIGTLTHLRFLDLSNSRKIGKLPDSITSLYGLQTLILIGCWNLRELPDDISNLVNLRHLFLPVGSFSSYTRPLMGMGNLTNLQTLSAFVVGSNNRGELRDLSQLRGTLDISKLENAGNINGTEAMVANLRNKPHLLGLRLSWGEDKSAARPCNLGRDEKVEEDLLDQLQPHTNLELLWIQNYSGRRCPSWMDHRSCFSNLQTVGLFNSQKFLPCLRQLPLLKNLVIQGCDAMESVGSKLFDGDDSSSSSAAATKKFRSLETLRILYMDEWEEWLEGVEEQGEEGGGGQFPCLRELIINGCPKLKMFCHCFPALEELEIYGCDNLRELPRLLSKLRRLHIANCPKVAVLPSLPSIETLDLYRCEQIIISSSSTTSAPCVHNSFPSLRELRITKCPNLRGLPSILPSLELLEISYSHGMVLNDEMLPNLSSLSSLIISLSHEADRESLPNRFMQHLTALKDLSLGRCILPKEIGFDLLPPSLQDLRISDCDNVGKLLQSLCNFHRLEILSISNVRGVASLPDVMHNLTSGLPTALQQLKIQDCESLDSLPKGLHTLTSLQQFTIRRCPALVSFPETRLPTALQQLEIQDCETLESLPKGLHTLTSLQQFTIRHCPALVSFPETGLPTALQQLEIQDCETLESLPKGLHTLMSLEHFQIRSCPALVSFPETGLPTALQQLEILDCESLESLPKGLHTLMSLEHFEIRSCPALVSFPETGLSTALQQLEIEDCKKLESLPKGLHTLMSLQRFAIRSCLALVSFPKTGLPTALQQLKIEDYKNLESLPKGLHTLTSLQQFTIRRCPALVSFPETGLPTALQQLEIQDCESLESLPKGLHTLMSLKHFKIQRCPALVSFPETGLPTALKQLEIKDCKNLLSLPKGLHTLTSLQNFKIRICPALVSFPETGLPTALKQLEIEDCKNLESQPMGLLHKLTSLRILIIKECPALESFPDMGLPTSLRTLFVEKCGKLNVLPNELHKLTNLLELTIEECSFFVDCKNQETLLYWGLHNLNSLSSLTIIGCPALVSITKGMLPTNLKSFHIEDCPILESLHDGLSDLNFLEWLEIKKCPMLKQRLQEKGGEEWSKIAHIPHDVVADGAYIILNGIFLS